MRIFASKVFWIIFSTILLLLCGIFLLEGYAEESWGWSTTWVSLLKTLFITLLATTLIGSFFEYGLRFQLTRDFKQYLDFNFEKNLIGLIKYYPSWKNLSLGDFFKKGHNIKIYVNYARSVFDNNQEEMHELLQRRNVNLEIFMLAEDNPFLESLGQLWGINDPAYNADGLRKKIRESRKILLDAIEHLAKDDKLNAKVAIFQLHRHPVFYSFYMSDNEILFVPSKIIGLKRFRPFVLHVKDTGAEKDIYNHCLTELEEIKKFEGAISEVYKN